MSPWSNQERGWKEREGARCCRNTGNSSVAAYRVKAVQPLDLVNCWKDKYKVIITTPASHFQTYTPKRGCCFMMERRQRRKTEVETNTLNVLNKND